LFFKCQVVKPGTCTFLPFLKGQQKLDTARRVLDQMNTLQATGRMVIELKDIRALKGSEFDLTLRDGDTLYVPQKPDEVMVIGQVYNATTFLYQKRHKRDDYVKLAGGATPYADTGHIFTVRANGMVETGHGGWGSRGKVQPGDAIVVPEDVDTFNFLDSMLDWSKVIMNIGMGAATMKALKII